jgi:hypothetical protein
MPPLHTLPHMWDGAHVACERWGLQGLCTPDGVWGCAHTCPQCACHLTCRAEGTVPPTGLRCAPAWCPSPSLVCVMTPGCVWPHSHGPFAHTWGAGQKGEGGPFLWGPVCVAPTHKWREGDLHTAYVPTAHSCPCGPSHCTPQCLWGGGGGACVTPACAPLLVHACVRALLPVTATPDTPDCAEANWGGGCTAKGCMQFPSSAGHPVLCAQGRKWGRNGGQHLHTPVRWAGRGWKGGWHHLPRGGPPLCPLSANAGVREGGGLPFTHCPTFPICAQSQGGANPAHGRGGGGNQ